MSYSSYLYGVLESNELNSEKIGEFLERSSNTIKHHHATLMLRIAMRDKRCSVDLVQLFLRFGAYVNGTYNGQEPPLHDALRYCRGEAIVRVLLDGGAHVHEEYGETPLCLALQYRASKDVIILLLEAGCSPDACKKHDSVMHCAMGEAYHCLGLKEDVVNLLIEKTGADVNRIDSRGQSPICRAFGGSSEVRDIEILLRAGASLSACKKHDSPLFCAVEKSYETLKADVVKLLLEAGVSTDKVDKYGYTAMQQALLHKKYETGAMLLLFHHLGGDINNVWHDENGSLLHLAVGNSDCELDVVKFLLEQGAQVHRINASGKTALHIAAFTFKCQTSVINVLLKYGSPVNAVDKDGQTPLRLAVELLRLECLAVCHRFSDQKKISDIFQSLLAAGARIADDKTDSLLKITLDLADNCERSLNLFKLLVKYSFLENPNFDIRGLIQGRSDYKNFISFAEDCVRELREMESLYVGRGRTLREFLGVPSLPQVDVVEVEPENYDNFNHLLRVLAVNEFPTLFDVISAKVYWSTMKAKLRDLSVYTVKLFKDLPCMENKVILNYDCACKISTYLSHDEFLHFILAFYNTDDHTEISNSGHVSKKRLKGERSPEQSSKFPKLHL